MMPEVDSSLVDKIITNMDPTNVLFVVVCIIALIYAYRKQLYDVLETYVFGKMSKEKKETKSSKKESKNETTSEIMTVLSDIKSEISEIKHAQKLIQEEQQSTKTKIESITNELEDTGEKMNQIVDSQEFLIKSDKEDKKAFIVRSYNDFYIKLKKIDMHSKETIEHIYEIYLKENGDTFVSGMMTAIRSLPVVTQISSDDETLHLNIKDESK